MRVLLVAHDKAPSDAFDELSKELQKQGHKTIVRTAHGGDRVPVKVEDITIADVIVLGMSSSPELSETEIYTAKQAQRFQVSFGFYADTWGCHRRPWFEEFRRNAQFLFVINGKEAKNARPMFPNATIVVSGNPCWEDYFTPKLTRQESRKRMGAKDDEKVILVPGGKNLIVNVLHFGGVIEAANLLQEKADCYETGIKLKVIISLHPGDRNGAGAYSDLVKYSKKVPVEIWTKDKMSSSELLPGSDLVIESASSLGIEAACQRIPVIDYFSEIALARLEEATGDRKWPLCEEGAALEVIGSTELYYCMGDILWGRSVRELRKYQEMVFPKPKEKGFAVRTMIQTLESLVAVRQ